MTMKKTVSLFLVILLLLLSLASCRALELPDDGVGSSDTIAADVATRIAYYETLVGSLNDELLALRRELYLSTGAYEARIAALENALRANGGTLPTDESAEQLFRFRITEEGAEVLAYLGDESRLSLPATLGGVPVVAIGERAFAENTTLVSVELPPRLRSVGWFAFYGCISLSSVTLGDAIESIAYGAFDNCARTLTFVCPVGSYAETYAHSYGLGVASQNP